MALIDFEAAWLDLAVEVGDRQGIGRDALFALMKRLEVKHQVSDREFTVPQLFNDPSALTETAWLSGFTDGEGTFGIRLLNRSGGRRYCSVYFSIALRADDSAVLFALKEVFGGHVNIEDGNDSSRPKARWAVTARDSLPAIIAYFDRFPPRAKKARDYALWREAATRYCAGASGSDERLDLIRVELARVREYTEPDLEDLRAAARGEEQVGDAASTDDGQEPGVGTKSVPGNGNAMIDKETQDANDSRSARDLARV